MSTQSKGTRAHSGNPGRDPCISKGHKDVQGTQRGIDSWIPKEHRYNPVRDPWRCPSPGGDTASAGAPATLRSAGTELRKAFLHLSRHRPAPRGDGDVGVTGEYRGPPSEPAAAGSARHPCPLEDTAEAALTVRALGPRWVAGSVAGCLARCRSRVPSRPLTVPARLHVAGVAPLRVREARAGRCAGDHGSCSSCRAGRP